MIKKMPPLTKLIFNPFESRKVQTLGEAYQKIYNSYWEEKLLQYRIDEHEFYKLITNIFQAINNKKIIRKYKKERSETPLAAFVNLRIALLTKMTFYLAQTKWKNDLDVDDVFWIETFVSDLIIDLLHRFSVLSYSDLIANIEKKKEIK